jgi:hypothetical protein
MSLDAGSLSPDGRWQVAQALLRSRSAAMAQLCEIVVGVDAAGDWEVDGCASLHEWVAQAGSLTEAVARQVVVTARRLAELPALLAALAEGRLSWEQVVPAARLATPDTDVRLAEELVGVSPAAIEVLARSRRREPDDRDRSRPSLRIRRTAHGAHVSMELPDVEAAVFATAIDHLARRGGPNPDTGLRDPIDVRRGEALCEAIAELAATDPAVNAAVRSQVVVHTEASVIDTGEGAGRLGLSIVDPDGVNRLLCDAELTWICHDGHGHGVGIARVGRETPAWLARRILDRDLACRFPGCERRIRQIHHLRRWTDGGETTSDNLVGLCWTHHHAVHDGRWGCVGDGDGEITFTSPITRRRFTSTARPEWTPPRTTPTIRRRARVHLTPAAVPARARARTSAA